MTNLTRMETQVSLALDAIQGKRRIERVLEAATALIERYNTIPETTGRLTASYELVRRNFTPQVALRYGELRLGDEPELGDVEFRAALTGADGTVGTVTASYTAPGTLGLTVEEWLAAMRLLIGVLGLGVGGRAT